MKLQVKKGSTDVTLIVFIQDSTSTTGAGKTGLAWNTGSLVCYYARPRVASAQLSLATQTVTGAHSDGGFVEIDSTNLPGFYRLDLSDAVVATGVDSVAVMLKGATGMAPTPLEIMLVAYDPQDSAGLGLSRIDATVGSRATQTSVDTVDDFLDTEIAAIKAKTDNLPASPAATGDIPSAATIATTVWANATRTLTSFGTLVSDIWANATRTLSAFGFSVTVGTNNDKTDYVLSTAGVNAVADQIWDEATSGHQTAGTTGKALTDAGSSGDPWSTALPGAYGAGTAGKIVGDNLNATMGSRATPADVLTQVNAAFDASQSEVSAIPTATGTMRDMIKASYALLRNKYSSNKSGGTMVLYKENSSTTLGSGTFTDDGNEIVRNKLS